MCEKTEFAHWRCSTQSIQLTYRIVARDFIGISKQILTPSERIEALMRSGLGVAVLHNVSGC